MNKRQRRHLKALEWGPWRPPRAMPFLDGWNGCCRIWYPFGILLGRRRIKTSSHMCCDLFRIQFVPVSHEQSRSGAQADGDHSIQEERKRRGRDRDTPPHAQHRVAGSCIARAHVLYAVIFFSAIFNLNWIKTGAGVTSPSQAAIGNSSQLAQLCQ